MITLTTALIPWGAMRNPQIDVTALLDRLCTAGMHLYAADLERAVGRLNESNENRLTPSDVEHFNEAVSGSKSDSLRTRNTRRDLKEFINKYRTI